MSQRVRVGRLVAAVSVRKSLALAVAATAIITMAVAGAGLMQMRSVADKGKAIYSKGVLPTAEVGELRELVWRARFESLSGTTAVDDESKKLYADKFATTLGQIDSTVALFRQHDLNTEQFKATDKFTTAWSAYLTARATGQELLAAGDTAGWEKNRQEHLTPATNDAISALDELDVASSKVASASLEETNKALSNAQLVVIAIMIGGVIVALVVAVALGKVTEQVAHEPASSDEDKKTLKAFARPQHAMKQEIHEAVERDQLETRFQPVVDLVSNRPVGVEMTMLWAHPSHGTVQSGELLALAEDEGVGAEVGDWALRQACRKVAGWLRDGHKLWISVSVTPERLARLEFVGEVALALDKHKIPAAHLMIKVPGSAFDSAEARARGHHAPAGAGGGLDSREQAMSQNLTKLRSMGVRVAVEYVGGGAASLVNLRRVPLNLLMAERRLMVGAAMDELVTFAHQIGAEVSVCGLADQNDADLVRASGCRYGQGESVSPPVSGDHMDTYLKRLRSQRV